MSSFYELNGIFINKSKNHAPVTGNTERQESNEWGRKVLRVKSWIVRIFLQMFNENRKLNLLRLREITSTLEEMRMIDNLKHFWKVQQEKSSYSQNVVWVAASSHGALCVQNQDDSLLQNHVQPSLLQVNGASLFLQQVKYYSWYLHSTLDSQSGQVDAGNNKGLTFIDFIEVRPFLRYANDLQGKLEYQKKDPKGTGP